MEENKNDNKINYKALGICALVAIVFIGMIVYSNSSSPVTPSSSYKSNSSSSGSSSNNYKSNSSSSGSSTKKSGGCTYKYSDGSTCGRSVGSHAPLCDYHFKELDSTYKSLTGGY